MKKHSISKFLKNLPKDVSLRQLAVMNVDEGEEVLGGYVTPHIPQIGMYKLIAKKKKDGTCEWAHFVQRDDGRKEKVYRGSVESKEKLATVVDAINRALNTAYGPAVRLVPSGSDMFMPDGTPIPNTRH